MVAALRFAGPHAEPDRASLYKGTTVTTKVKFFLSSPGDVGEERAEALRIIEKLSREFAQDLEISSVVWEHEPLVATQSFQDQIEKPSSCDIVVCILWTRIGTRLPANFVRADGSRYDSGTQFEIEDSYQSWCQTGRPDLLVFKKTADLSLLVQGTKEIRNRIEQKEKLDSFIDSWFKNPDGSNRAAIHRFKSATDFVVILESMLRKLLADRFQLTNRRRITWDKGSPFRGLNVFGFEHAAIYFGRNRAVSEVLNRLRSRSVDGCSFVLILGMSGGGKSSLVRAGVLPTLTSPGVIEGVAAWRYAVLKPSDGDGNILKTLVSALVQPHGLPELLADGSSVNQLVGMLRDPTAIVPLVKGGLSQVASNLQSSSNASQPDVRLCLLVDQLEELFSEEFLVHERQVFASAIRALAECGRVWVLATLRGDCFDNVFTLPDLLKLQEGPGQYVLQPPSASELSQMIQGPMQAAGLMFEPPLSGQRDLGEELQDEVLGSPGALPLLEFALDEMHQRCQDGMMTRSAFIEIGELSGAIGKRADDVVKPLGAHLDAACSKVFSALVRMRISDSGEYVATSPSAALSEFPVGSGPRVMIEALISARIFTSDQGKDKQPRFRLAHESIMRYWSRLSRWVESNRENLLIKLRLEEQAQAWNKNRRNDLLLSPGKPLDDARVLLNSTIATSHELKLFVGHSEKNASRRVVAYRAALATFLVLFFLLVGALFIARSSTIRAENAWSTARLQLRDAGRSDYSIAQASFAEGKWRNGLAHLARAVRNDPNNLLAQESLWIAALYGQRDAAPLPTFEISSSPRFQYANRGQEELLVVLDDHGTVVGYNLRDGSAQNQFELDPQTVMIGRGSDEVIVTVAVVTDAQGWLRAMVQLVNPSGQKLGDPYPYDGVPWGWLNASGKRLLLSGTQYAAIWNTETHQLIKEIPNHGRLLTPGQLTEDFEAFIDIERVPPGLCSVRDPSHVIQSIPNTSRLSSALLSPDGKWLVLTDDSQTRIWDMHKEQFIGMPIARSAAEESLSAAIVSVDTISPDSLTLAIANDQVVEFWDLPSGNRLGRPVEQPGAVRSVSFGGDGQSVAILSDDLLNVWDVVSSKAIGPAIQGVESGGFSPQGKHLLARKKNGNLSVWPAESWIGMPVVLDHGSAAIEVAFPSDNYLQTISENSVSSWDTNNLNKRGSLTVPPQVSSSISFASEGNRILAIGDSEFCVLDPDLNSSNELVLGKLQPAPSASVCSDRRHVVSLSSQNELLVWDSHSGKTVGPAIALGESIESGVVSPSGERLVLLDSAKRCELWNLKSGTRIAKLVCPFPVTKADFSKENELVALTCQANELAGSPKSASPKLLFFDGISGEQIGGSLPLTSSYLFALCPQGRAVLVGEESKLHLLIRDPVKKSLATKFSFPMNGNVTNATFSPDGQHFAVTGTHEITLWSLNEQQPVGEAIGFSRTAVPTVRFSNNGQRLAVVDGNRTRLFDTGMGVPIGTELQHPYCSLCQFSPSGRNLLLAPSPSLFTLWQCRPKDDLTALQLSKLAEVLAGATLDPDSGFICELPTIDRLRSYEWLKRSIPSTSDWHLLLASARMSPAELSLTPSSAVTRGSLISSLLESKSSATLNYALKLGRQHPLASLRFPLSFSVKYAERCRSIRSQVVDRIPEDFVMLQQATHALVEVDKDSAKRSLERCRRLASTQEQLDWIAATEKQLAHVEIPKVQKRFSTDPLTSRSLVQLSEDGSLRGRVLSLSESTDSVTPTDPVRVHLFKDNMLVAHAVTNEQGEFSIPVVSPDAYSIVAVGEHTLAITSLGVVDRSHEVGLPLSEITLTSIGSKDIVPALSIISRHSQEKEKSPKLRTEKLPSEPSPKSNTPESGSHELVPMVAPASELHGRIAASLELQSITNRGEAVAGYFWSLDSSEVDNDILSARLSGGAKVFLLREGNVIAQAMSQKDGQFSFNGLSPATYSVIGIADSAVCVFSIKIRAETLASRPVRLPYVNVVDLSPVDQLTGILAPVSQIADLFAPESYEVVTLPPQVPDAEENGQLWDFTVPMK